MQNRLMSFLLALSLLLMTAGCMMEQKHVLRIGASPWIGYSPLFYAQQKGWLEEIDVSLVLSPSLHETQSYFDADLIDGFVSTQYEALHSSKELIHYLPMDRSYGADVILSNRSLEKLLKSKTITAYFEVDTFNKIVFENFLLKNNFSPGNIAVFNKPQSVVKDMSPHVKEDMLIVTLDIHVKALEKRGFVKVGSTKEKGIVLMNSLYISSHFLKKHPTQAKQLEAVILKAYKKLQEDPHEYYETVKEYLYNLTYEEFKDALLKIQWQFDKSESEIQLLVKNYDLLPVEKN